MKYLSILVFGFLMSIGWYTAKAGMWFVNDRANYTMSKRKSRKIINNKYIR